MPKRKRVGQKRDRGNSRSEPRVLESNPECSKTSNTDQQVQVSLSGGRSEINIGEIRTILGDIEQRFVNWIIEGVQAVQKETVVEALRQIQTIKSFLNETTAILEYSENGRQRQSGDSIKPLMDSANYLKTVIENYKQNVGHTEPEVNRHNHSFDDMFQDDVHDKQNMPIGIQDSSVVKSILKSTNVDCNITRKRISFAEKATEVYQDYETSQISLTKSSPRVKRLEGNTMECTAENPEHTDLVSNGAQAPSKSTIPLQTPMLDPYETSIAEESPSIIETSFLKDSVSSFHTNYTKNLKNFRPKIKGKKKLQDPDENKSQFTEAPFGFFQTNLKKNSSLHQNFELGNKADLYTCNASPHDIQDSDIFSDELVKTFMSQIIENCEGDNISQHQDNISLPFHNFFLSLPGSSSSQDSLDASVRMAVNIATGSAVNSKDSNPRNDGITNIEGKSEGKWIPENSTEIIQSSEPFSEGSAGWMGTLWENVKDDGNMVSGNSSLNVSLLFDETNEASLIPGTSCLQNTNSYKDQTQIITKPILNAKEQDSANDAGRYDINASQVGLQNAPQHCPLFQPCYNIKLSALHNATKATEVADMTESVKLQETGTEGSPKIFTVLENAVHSNRNPLEPGNLGPPRSVYPVDGGNVPRRDPEQNAIKSSDTGINNTKSDDTKKILLKAPSFHPPTQTGDVFNHQQPILSFSDLNKMQIAKELKKVPGYESNSNGLNSTNGLESTISQCPKKIGHPPTNDENKSNNTKLIQSDMGTMRSQGEAPNNKEIDITIKSIPPTDSAQKNMLENRIFQPPIEDSRQGILMEKNGSLTGMQQDGMKNVLNRFQETLLTGHWLMSGLQRNTTSNLFSSLKPIANLETCKSVHEVSKNTISISSHSCKEQLGEIQQNQEISFKFNTTPNDGELNNPVQGPNIRKAPETQQEGYSIEHTIMGHSKLNENQSEFWKPRKCSSFSALSDTEPVEKGKNLNTNHELWAERSNRAELGRNAAVCPKEHFQTAYGVSTETGTTPKQIKPFVKNVDSLNNHLGSSLNKDEDPHRVENSQMPYLLPLISLAHIEEKLVCSANYSNKNQLHQTSLDQQGHSNTRDEIMKENLPNSSDTKLQQELKPKTETKKLMTPAQKPPKRNRSNKINKCCDETQQLGGSFGSSQNEKSSQKPKATRKKSSQRTKSTAQSHEFSLEDLNKDVNYNAQNLGLLLNWSQPSADQKGTQSGDKSSTLKNTDSSKDPRPIDMKRNRKINRQKPAAIINQQRELFALANNAVIPARERADLRQKLESQTHVEQQSNQKTNFNFFNPLTSKNEADTSPNYQAIGGNVENGYLDMNTVRNIELQSNQQQNYKECIQLGSKMCYTERDNMSWVEDTKYTSINCDGNSYARNIRDNTPGAVNGPKNDIQAKTLIETPIEFVSMTQLSWGELATCGIPSVLTQGCSPIHQAMETATLPPATSRTNTPQEQPPIGEDAHNKTYRGIHPEEYRSLTQLSWGQSATCGIPASPQELTAICGRGGIQQVSKSTTHKEAAVNGEIQNTVPQTANSHVFKQPFAPNQTEDNNPSFSFTEFMQDICVSSTENVYDSPTLPPKSKTEEEEIEEILNNIQFVRTPHETELIEANSIEELINDQTFIW